MDGAVDLVSVREKTAQIVGSYVANNSVPSADLPGLIQSVFAALGSLSSGSVEDKPAEPLKPAVPVRKSVSDDHIVCLEDGKKFKSLKRHLATYHDLSPAEYRAKWELPASYPMVAPNYAATRSQLAKSLGLGRKVVMVEEAVPVPARRRRKPKLRD